MPRKDFKAGVERFMSSAMDTHGADDTHDTHDTRGTQDTQGAHKAFYRINLKLRPQYREYLELEAWKEKKSITEYINDLIANDQRTKGQS